MYTRTKGVSKMARNKSYDIDFKKMIVELYQKQNKTGTEIKREYGIGSSTLYKWCKLYGEIKTSTGEITSNDEINKLKKQLAEIKMENEILKKAIAIFTQK